VIDKFAYKPFSFLAAWLHARARGSKQKTHLIFVKFIQYQQLIAVL
jgi:hypothetical protein